MTTSEEFDYADCGGSYEHDFPCEEDGDASCARAFCECRNCGAEHVEDEEEG